MEKSKEKQLPVKLNLQLCYLLMVGIRYTELTDAEKAFTHIRISLILKTAINGEASKVQNLFLIVLQADDPGTGYHMASLCWEILGLSLLHSRAMQYLFF